MKIYYNSSLWSKGKGPHGLPLHNCFSVPSFQKVDTSHFVLEGINIKKCDGKEYSYKQFAMISVSKQNENNLCYLEL